MKNVLLSILLLLVTLSVNAQFVGAGERDTFFNGQKDSLGNKKEITVTLDGETKFTDYKVISLDNDTTFIDTTLTIKKDYKLNYLRKDDFELVPFHNQGQTYSKLSFNFENNSIFPGMGISAKRYNYNTVKDIHYYYVPTPTTEIMYRTGLEQGQVLDALITMNMSRQLNLSIAYKGLRSLGKYRHALSSHGNFRTTFNYTSKNNKYAARGHFSSFDFYNDENGGLTDDSAILFESGNTNYVDRARLEVNYTNADNMFEGKRYFLDHTYTLFSKNENQKRKNDSIQAQLKKRTSYEAKVRRLKIDTLNLAKNQTKIDSLNFLITSIQVDTTNLKQITSAKEIFIKLGHTLEYETQHYRFNQTSANSSIYGDFYNSSIGDHTSYQKFSNQLYAKFKSPYLGELKGGIRNFDYNYNYNSILFLDNKTIASRLKGNAIAFEADWKTNYKNFYITANASTILSGDITGSSLKASAYIKKDSVFTFKGLAEFTTKNPDFNKILYQSDYKNYNWQNNFKNEDITSIGFEFTSNKWGAVKGSYNVVDNYTYFNEDALPTQASETLNYFKVTANKAISVGKFTLDNTVMYQKIAKGEDFFRAPELVTRNSLYFSDHIFKGDPMYLQTGFTLKYFTKYYAGAYNPVLSEFTIQNKQEIGNFPIVDFFVNAQIQRTRLYFKIENFTASFTGREYYAAPNYPYRDLTVRFGLVWNFFI